MGALKDKMIEWMEDENLSEEDLEVMEDVNKRFMAWAINHLTPEQV